MVEIFDIKIIYFIIVLILGFMIGFFIKKKEAEKKIKDYLSKLEKDLKKSRETLQQAQEQFFATKNRHTINKDILFSQTNLEKRTKEKINDYKKKILSLQEVNESLKIEKEQIKAELAEIEENVKATKYDFTKINNIVHEFEILKQKDEKLDFEISSLKENIKKFTEQKTILQTQYEKEIQENKILDKDIELLKIELEYILEQKKILKNENFSDLDEKLENIKNKVINYRKKLEEFENKNMQNINLSKEQIEHFIEKNEKESLIDKFFSTIIDRKKGLL